MANYEEFADPNSGIAKILQLMQSSARRSNPEIDQQQALQGMLGPEPPPPFQGEMGPEGPDELIARLLHGEMGPQ